MSRLCRPGSAAASHSAASIFRCYAELGSVRLLKAELEVQGRKSKSWTSAAGRVIGGKPFSRGALYLMLEVDDALSISEQVDL